MNNEIKKALMILQDGEEEFSTPNGLAIISDYQKIYDFMMKHNIDNLLMPDFGEPIEDTVGDTLGDLSDKYDYSEVDGFALVDQGEQR